MPNIFRLNEEYMMKIVAFGASNSKNSINKKLATYAAQQVAQAEVEVLDLNDFELPLFSVDKEIELGQPKLAKAFLHKLWKADVIIISFAEHNGTYTAAYKNLFDWCSRIEPKVFNNKPMLLLSTSPGARGGASVLSAAIKSIPYFGGKVIGSMAMPSFNDSFDVDANKLIDSELKDQLLNTIKSLINSSMLE